MNKTNPLESGKISSLMTKFAIPSIIAMLVGSIYNIVDQLFIGNKVGTLGNAATNIAFPINTLCIAAALFFGIGGAAGYNLKMGAKETESAPYFLGTSLSMLLISGVVITLVTEVFLSPLLVLFGSPADVLPYAIEYVRIVAFGFPFLILTGGGGHLVRADGSPQMTMICNLSGAIINVGLDALFIYGFKWGMSGAALATVIGQVFSGILVIYYFARKSNVKLKREHFILQLKYVGKAFLFGMAQGGNQIAMMFVNIISNNLLKYYGRQSVYGEIIPIACSGIVAKVTMLYFAVIIGLSQGAQPIESFNYGAKKYDRVKKAFFLALSLAELISIIAFVLFQFFPKQILALFGDATNEYFEFGSKYMRTFLFFTFLNGFQPISSNFFSAIGKAWKGTFLALTRQIIYLLPLIIVLPRFFQIDGFLYAGMIADGLAFVTTLIMIMTELKHINALSRSEYN